MKRPVRVLYHIQTAVKLKKKVGTLSLSMRQKHRGEAEIRSTHSCLT